MKERLLALYRTALAQLRQRSAREQLLLAGVGFTVLLVLLQLVVVAPLHDALAARRTAAEQADLDLGKAALLAPGLQSLRTQLAQVEQRIQPGTQTNLLQLLEQLAKEAEIKVENIRQKVGDRNERYPETRVEVELRGATLAQTVQYLYKIESAPIYLIVRSLAIRARGDAQQLLDVTFSVSSFQRA